MTTYSAIANGEIDALSPVTDLLLTRFRDNPIAIAEGDPSVPLELQLTPPLGTLTTTSGTSQTLSGLVLTNYKFLRLWFRAVQSPSVGTPNLLLAGTNIFNAMATSSQVRGEIVIDLSDGTARSVLSTAAATSIQNFASGILNSTTSITLSLSSGSFAGGSVRFYGEK